MFPTGGSAPSRERPHGEGLGLSGAEGVRIGVGKSLPMAPAGEGATRVSRAETGQSGQRRELGGAQGCHSLSGTCPGVTQAGDGGPDVRAQEEVVGCGLWSP